MSVSNKRRRRKKLQLLKARDLKFSKNEQLIKTYATDLIMCARLKQKPRSKAVLKLWQELHGHIIARIGDSSSSNKLAGVFAPNIVSRPQNTLTSLDSEYLGIGDSFL